MSSYNKSKIKKYVLNYLNNHINNINEDYLKDFHFIIFMNDKFKAELLKEIQKQISNIIMEYFDCTRECKYCVAKLCEKRSNYIKGEATNTLHN